MADINKIDGSGDFVYGASFAQLPPGNTNLTDGTLDDRASFYSSLPQPAILPNFGINYVDASTFGPLTDGSGSIVDANVSQVVFAAKPQRNYLSFINTSNTTMYVNIDGAASTTNSFPVVSNGQLSFEDGFIPDGQVTVICASSGKTFVAKEG